VADVFRRHGEQFLEAFGDSTSVAQKRVLQALSACRTSALGGHVDGCDACGHLAVSYNSCRNRHCPKCLVSASAKWLDARSAELLPVPYYHVVFTLPASLGPLALQNKKVVYEVLFEAASQTLLKIAADPKHLGAQPGFLAILHTWGQNLLHHPHVHCVVPGGGIAPDRKRWIGCLDGFFLPVRVLSPVFRGKFLDLLGRSFDANELAFHGDLAHLADLEAFQALLRSTRKKPWVVYAKPPFGGPEQVLKYLARYTHRVAIANSRLLSLDEGKVTFRWKDYADGNTKRRMTLDATEFIRRFLLHVLPKGYVRIRHYGFLANRARQRNLELCRRLLRTSAQAEATQEAPPPLKTSDSPMEESLPVCPACRKGRMVRLRELEPFEVLRSSPIVPGFDSS
jgi:hypothetical protein